MQVLLIKGYYLTPIIRVGEWLDSSTVKSEDLEENGTPRE
jgi:hypothetical protein